MRIGLIGDVHGAHEHLETALHWLRTETLDAICCIGDIAEGPGDLNLCIEMLRENAVQTVRGNHDEWLLQDWGRRAHSQSDLSQENREWLQNLPLTREFESPVGPVLLCHGVGENFMRNLRGDDDHYNLGWNEELQNLQREDRIRCILNGHTHRRHLGYFGSILNLNAGKLSESHDGLAGGVWVVDFQKRRATLRLFERASHLTSPLELRFEERFWESL